LSSFIPEQYRSKIDAATDVIWRVFNLCGLVGRLQQCFMPRQPKPAEAKKESTEHADTEAPLTLDENKKDEP